MARKPRKYGETGIYHVILRGNNQETIFYNDQDRFFFLARLQKYISQLGIELYSYCLMGNHVHILIGNANQNMSLFIKKLTCSYVYYFNHKYDRTGHLFQGRYKSEPVETEKYFKTVYRYILKNPEKAGLGAFQTYKWSSINSIENKDNKINISFVLNVFGSKHELLRFLTLENDDQCMEYFTQKISDDDLKAEFIKQLFKIKSPLQLNECSFFELRSRLAYLKSIGISINQLSRLSGINKSVIRNA